MRVEILSRGVALTAEQHTWVQRRISFALARFGARIRSLRMTLRDANGPRGGPDHECLIEAQVVPVGPVVVEVIDVEVESAVSRALDRIARRVRDETTRRREVRRRGRPRTIHAA